MSESDRAGSVSAWLGRQDSSGLKSGLPKALGDRKGVTSKSEGAFNGDDGSGVWCIFLLLAPRSVCAGGVAEPLASRDSFRGLEPRRDRFRA